MATGQDTRALSVAQGPDGSRADRWIHNRRGPDSGVVTGGSTTGDDVTSLSVSLKRVDVTVSWSSRASPRRFSSATCLRPVRETMRTDHTADLPIRSGMSLLELMVVVAILGIVMLTLMGIALSTRGSTATTRPGRSSDERAAGHVAHGDGNPAGRRADPGEPQIGVIGDRHGAGEPAARSGRPQRGRRDLDDGAVGGRDLQLQRREQEDSPQPRLRGSGRGART